MQNSLKMHSQALDMVVKQWKDLVQEMELPLLGTQQGLVCSLKIRSAMKKETLNREVFAIAVSEFRKNDFYTQW